MIVVCALVAEIFVATAGVIHAIRVDNAERGGQRWSEVGRQIDRAQIVRYGVCVESAIFPHLNISTILFWVETNGFRATNGD